MKRVYLYVALVLATSLHMSVHAGITLKERMAAAAAAKKQQLRDGFNNAQQYAARRGRSHVAVTQEVGHTVSEMSMCDAGVQQIPHDCIYNQTSDVEYTVADIQAADVGWVRATLQPILFKRAARLMMPSELDTAVFEICLDQLTLDECLTLARMKSPLLYASNALLTLAHKESHAPLFDYLYQLLPDALTAKIFVRYVLMVRGQLEIIDMPEYVALCKQFLTVFAPPSAFVPLQNQATIQALLTSYEINDLLLLKALVTPEMSGVEGVRSITPFMPQIVARLAARLPQTKESFKEFSFEHKRAAAIALVIIITIGKDNEVVPDIYPWVAIFTEQVAAHLYDACLAAPALLKHDEIMRLGLPASVGNHVGKLRFVPRNLAIKKIVGIMKLEEQKQAIRNANPAAMQIK